jgi:choice-of-anchor B domain-containing protein
MVRRYILIFILFHFYELTYSQLNIQFRGQLGYGVTNELANIGGYVDSTGREYALVGCQTGLSIVDVTNPVAPVQKILIPGTNSFWREVKVWGKYAYVTTEGGTLGLQIINLGKLPGTITTADYKYWKGNGAILNMISRLHSLHIDNGYAYLNGVNGGGLNGGACLIVSLADPWNPNYMGNTALTFAGNQRYVHDCFVRNDTLWGAHINAGFFSIINVSNKSNPSLIGTGTVTTPGAFTHNAWLNTSGVRTLFTTDEVSGSYMTAYDVSNPSNITEIDRVQLTPGSGSIVHNTHIKNNYAIVSWYKDGIAIIDVSRPDNMIVTGSYDTYTQGSGNGFNGCWGVYPYLPSGNIVASDINNGLFVLTPTYVRGCYLEGTITDTCSGVVIPNATVTINTVNISKQGKLTGIYKTGTAIPGTYSVTFSKAGYISKTVNNVTLTNGVLTSLNVKLKPINAVAISSALITNTTCNGSLNGSVNVTAAGGGTPYQWLWSNGNTTEDLSSVGAGLYSVTVTDAAGCKFNSQYSVIEPSAIQLSFTGTSPSCIENADGSITANVNGGTPGYIYQWNPLRSNINQNNSYKNKLSAASSAATILDSIPAGSYSLSVTDANGCVVSNNYILANATTHCEIDFQLRLFSEGLYQSYQNMVPVIDSLQPFLADTFTILLAQDTIGYPFVYSYTAIADTAGRLDFQVPGVLWGSGYYIVIRHRNSIETWSVTPYNLDSIQCLFDFSINMMIRNPRQGLLMRNY